MSNRPNPKGNQKARAVAQARQSTRGPSLALWVLIGILGLSIVAVVIAAFNRNDPVEGQTQPVTIDGAALPRHDDNGDDAAVGETAPTLRGSDFTGEAVTVGGPSDQPSIVVFAAHWCPHCQAEVPRLVEWRADGTIPEDIRLVAVATGTDENQPNYPPQEWLEGEDWPGDVMADSEGGDAAEAYGLDAYPYFVALDADGTVTARGSGELDQQGIEDLVASLEQPQ